MKKTFFRNLLLGSIILICSSLFVTCTTSTSNENQAPLVEENALTALVWLSNPNSDIWLSKENEIYSSNVSGSSDISIILDTTKTYQTMEGFGASLTESSAYLLETQLSLSTYNEVLESLFGKTGIGISLLRQPMGATDFSLSAWTYDDIPSGEEDFDLTFFSLSPEDEYIRPALNKALAVQPGRISIIATPWSPPAWMKTIEQLNGSFGGRLRTDAYEAYANYFVKYLSEYDDLGSPVSAITVQNEPKYGPYYPGMLMDSTEAISFVSILSEALDDAGLGSVKILCYDHNYDDIEYPGEMLSSYAEHAISGTAFHYYTDWNHDNLSELHNQYPEKEIWATEAGSGSWISSGNDTGMFIDTMIHLVRFPRNWARSYITWNIALDQDGGPCLNDDESSNIGLLEIRSDKKDTYTFENTYYALGHSSKFVTPGAVRIYSSTYENKVETVAYKNPDGTTVVILLNTTSNSKDISIKYDSHYFWYTLPSKSAVTVVIQG